MYYFLGDIVLLAGNTVPADWWPCDGRLVPVSFGGGALFSVIGACYGGDGQSTFALPKLTPPAGLKGVGYCMVAYGEYPPRS